MTGARQLPEPLAQGDLARTPFAHVLLYIQKHALEGSLVVWQPEAGDARPRQDRILFDHGVPVAGRLVEAASRLDRALLPLFARGRGPYAFYEAEDLVGSGAGVLTGELAVLPLIAASLRGSSRDDVVAQICAGFGESKLRLELGADLERLGLLPEERAFCDLLRAEPMSVRRLSELSSLPPKMAERIVYLLALTKSIAPWDGELGAKTTSEKPAPAEAPRAPAQSPSPQPKRPERAQLEEAPSPPASLSAEHRALWEEVSAYAITIDDQNYFEMLDLARDAAASTVQKAYFTRVKKWHPDRLPKELAAMRPTAERIFHQLTLAQETLSDERARGAYLVNVQEGGGTPAADRKLARIVQAAMDFRKVEVLLRRRELDEALQVVEECLADNPDEPDYLATRGWVAWQLDPDTPGALASVEQALALAPNHDKAHYYRGMMLRRAGREREAIEGFRRAAELNPRNIEAVRMVRIAEMRGSEPDEKPGAQRRKAESKGGDSLFGKLFGANKKK